MAHIALHDLRRYCWGWAVALGLALGGATAAEAAVELRVAIEEQAPAVTVGSSTAATVRSLDGQPLGQVPSGRSLVVTPVENELQLINWQGQGFWVEPAEGGHIFINDAWYRGRVLLLSTVDGVTAINWVDVEAYLYSVLGGEMPTSWPIEALKAQAVAARSYALYHQQKGTQRPFDVSDSTASQVYRGLAAEASSTHAAVEATRGQVLTYSNRVIEAVFHSSSGGFTENVEDVWQQAVPYLRAVPDYDQGAPVFQWAETFSLVDFGRRVGGIGELHQVTIEETTPRGRVVALTLAGSEGSRRLSGRDLRRALGLRSTLFSVALAGDTVQVTGRGFGHGIGLSQWGARQLALDGHTYQQILGHYYQGVALAEVRVAGTP